MAASVTPKQIYQALISAGASTTEAIGIMANGIAESGLDPEAIGDQGTSFGLWQQHGSQYSTLVTGNPVNDMNAQVHTLAANGAFASASGSTGAQAAGNFAANYERCTTCQPGESSYEARVSNAATVAGWVSSGNWPTSAGSATAATSGGAGSTSNSTDPTCAWGFSGSLVVTSVNICVVKKTTLRHLAGGLLLLAGGGTVLVGAVILAASAFQRTGALGKAADAAAVVPGAAPVAAGLSRAHSRATRTGSRVRSQRERRQPAAPSTKGPRDLRYKTVRNP